MSFSPFKEVSTANPGTETRYGSDDLLDIMKILNAKIVSGRRPDILNPWRFSAAFELKQVTNPTAPTDANVIILYNDAADNKLKVKKSGGTVVNIEDLGSGAWNNSAAETITNKTIPIESNFIKHGTTNFVGDILYYDGTRYNRKAKGAANQVLAVNSAGTDLEWQTPAGGGGGAGEANTASNTGTAGIGFFNQKFGVDLEFKKIFSPTGTILISDNVANERVDVDLAPGIVTVNQANTYGDFQQTFRSSRLAITNPANTFAYFLVGSAITASRNITIPLLTANDTMAMVTIAQTLANKTHTACVYDVDTNTLKHSTTNAIGELLKNTGSKFDRLAKGAANTYLKVNAAGTDLEWGTVPGGTLDSLTDVTATSPSLGQTIRYNGTSWFNALLLLNDLSDVVISSPSSQQVLKHDGSNFVNSPMTLDNLSDVVITAPVNGQVPTFNGTQWVNQTPAGGGREELATHFGHCSVESLDSSYQDVPWVGTTGPAGNTDEGTKAIVPIDFTGKTQYKVTLALVVEGGSVTPDIKIVDDATPSNILHEFSNIGQNTHTTSLTALPGWATGLKTLRLQAGGGNGSANVYLPSTSVFLK